MILDYMYRLYQLYARCPRQKDMAFRSSAVRSRSYLHQACFLRKSGFRLSKKPRRVFRESGKSNQNHFPPGRVPGGKYFSGCKCGICLPVADKLCAQQTAKNCRKRPKAFSDKLKPDFFGNQGFFLFRGSLSVCAPFYLQILRTMV